MGRALSDWMPARFVSTEKGMPEMGMSPALVRAVTGRGERRGEVRRGAESRARAARTIGTAVEVEVDVLGVRHGIEEVLERAVVERRQDTIPEGQDERSVVAGRRLRADRLFDRELEQRGVDAVEVAASGTGVETGATRSVVYGGRIRPSRRRSRTHMMKSPPASMAVSEKPKGLA